MAGQSNVVTVTEDLCATAWPLSVQMGQQKKPTKQPHHHIAQLVAVTTTALLGERCATYFWMSRMKVNQVPKMRRGKEFWQNGLS